MVVWGAASILQPVLAFMQRLMLHRGTSYISLGATNASPVLAFMQEIKQSTEEN